MIFLCFDSMEKGNLSKELFPKHEAERGYSEACSYFGGLFLSEGMTSDIKKYEAWRDDNLQEMDEHVH